MAKGSPILEDRPLTPQEASLVRWLIEHGGVARATEYLPQLADTRVVSRCGCGCASVDFAVAGSSAPAGAPLGILADFQYQTAEGHPCGVFVFERSGMLAGLEVYSEDGLSTASTLPEIQQLIAFERDHCT